MSTWYSSEVLQFSSWVFKTFWNDAGYGHDCNLVEYWACEWAAKTATNSPKRLVLCCAQFKLHSTHCSIAVLVTGTIYIRIARTMTWRYYAGCKSRTIPMTAPKLFKLLSAINMKPTFFTHRWWWLCGCLSCSSPEYTPAPAPDSRDTWTASGPRISRSPPPAGTCPLCAVTNNGFTSDVGTRKSQKQ